MISTRLALLILILFIAHTTREFFEVRLLRQESQHLRNQIASLTKIASSNSDSISKLADGMNQLADASVKNSNASMHIMDLIGVKK